MQQKLNTEKQLSEVELIEIFIRNEETSIIREIAK
jgi:hypothetical protein